METQVRVLLKVLPCVYRYLNGHVAVGLRTGSNCFTLHQIAQVCPETVSCASKRGLRIQVWPLIEVGPVDR